MRDKSASRRDFVRLGLAAGALTLAREATAAPRGGYAGSTTHREHPLEFRLGKDFSPDVSRKAGRRLASAVLEFLLESHPPGMTLSQWDLNPRDMPFLQEHLERIVAHAFEGIRDNLEVYPVDPVLVLSLLYNESRFRPTVVSPAGAVGIAQFMPETALEYGLTPLGRHYLWERFRDLQRERRDAGAKRIEAFLERFGVASFSPEAVIDRALASGDLTILREFVAMNVPDEEVEEARRAYTAALERDFAAHDFFGDGAAALRETDARVGYGAVEKCVTYLARRLEENHGMITSAVAAYNAGPDAVRVRNPQSVLYRFGEVPALAETVRYVQRILAVYSDIKFRLYQRFR